MEIDAHDVYDVLTGKGVKHLHHANTVITACQFLRSGALLSRGTIERRKLLQSPQASDRIDKEMGVWFDVFLDSTDIHDRARRHNVYGPVLFVVDIEILKRKDLAPVWVTRCNPTKWDGLEHDKRWFTSRTDLKSTFVKGEFDQMVVFRHCGGELPFGKYLRKVIIDDPRIVDCGAGDIDTYSIAFGAIQCAVSDGKLSLQIEKRTCRPKCGCLDYYQKNDARTEAAFFPRLG